MKEPIKHNAIFKMAMLKSTVYIGEKEGPGCMYGVNMYGSGGDVLLAGGIVYLVVTTMAVVVTVAAAESESVAVLC